VRSDTIVELEGVNGEWFTLVGPDAGDEGVWLSDAGLTGIFDAPVKVVYEEPGNFPGARFLSSRILRRDIVFAVDIMNDSDYGGSDSWLSRDSAWRRAWSFTQDCTLYVTTEESGTRYLKLRLGEVPDISLKTDPKLNPANLAKMICIAGDPFWYEDDVVYSATTTTDTTFDPNPLPWPWPPLSLPTETLHITVDPSDGKGGLNPTDQPIWLTWTVPGSTLPPSQPYIPGIPWLGAPNSPATIWTVPDYSFDSGSDATRRLQLPPLIGGLRTNEVQTVAIIGDASPTGGTWTLTFDGQTTAGIAYNAAASAIKTALENLSNIQVNDTVVTALPQTNEVQEYIITGGPTGGTYTLSFNGQTTAPIAPWLGPGDVQLALGLLSNLNYFDIQVTATDVANEVQVVQLTGEPSGGTFTLTLNGQTTTPLAYNCSALDVSNAISALTHVGTFEVVVTRDFTPYAPFILTFSGGNVAGIDQNQITATSSLTGGSGVGVTTSTQQAGSTKYTITFVNNEAGVNVPQMTGSGASLTGGVSPGITVKTDVQGVKPYQILFQGTLSGLDVPALTMNTSGLTGGTNVSGLVQTITNGATATAENAIIDTDPRVEQVVSESGSALWPRMGGVRWIYPVPPWTKNGTFTITVSGAVIGQMVTLRIPRPWSRPWGLE
jgi:hypothetical protein